MIVFFDAVKYVNPITKVCIIRASREEYQKVWVAITMITSIGNCPVVFNLLDLSGKLNNSGVKSKISSGWHYFCDNSARSSFVFKKGFVSSSL